MRFMEKTLKIQVSDGSVLTIEATHLLMDHLCKIFSLDSHEWVTEDHVKNFVLSELLRAQGDGAKNVGQEPS